MKESKGTIITVIHEKGYGFILEEETEENIYFHSSGVYGWPFEDLREGFKCKFTKVGIPKGSKAILVEVVE